MVRRERHRGHALVDAAVRLVLVLAFLVLHDAALLVELVLADRADEVPHAIRFHPERHVERGRRNGFEIVRAVVPRRAVLVRRAGELERAEELVLVVLRALEHQVLEEVRETGLSGGLVGRADVIPDADRDDRRLVVFADDDREPVRQRERRERDVDRVGRRGRRIAAESGGQHECGEAEAEGLAHGIS